MKRHNRDSASALAGAMYVYGKSEDQIVYRVGEQYRPAVQQAIREVDAYFALLGELGGLKEIAGEQPPETDDPDTAIQTFNAGERRGRERGREILDRHGEEALQAEIERLDEARTGYRPEKMQR